MAEFIAILVDSGLLARVLVISGVPAFLLGAAIINGLATFGISELVRFMITMPLLLGSWFYFAGWIVDRWRVQRSR